MRARPKSEARGRAAREKKENSEGAQRGAKAIGEERARRPKSEGPRRRAKHKGGAREGRTSQGERW